MNHRFLLGGHMLLLTLLDDGEHCTKALGPRSPGRSLVLRPNMKV